MSLVWGTIVSRLYLSLQVEQRSRSQTWGTWDAAEGWLMGGRCTEQRGSLWRLGPVPGLSVQYHSSLSTQPGVRIHPAGKAFCRHQGRGYFTNGGNEATPLGHRAQLQVWHHFQLCVQCHHAPTLVLSHLWSHGLSYAALTEVSHWVRGQMLHDLYCYILLLMLFSCSPD